MTEVYDLLIDEIEFSSFTGKKRKEVVVLGDS